MIKVGIVGGAGYTGGELLRLLINHPNVTISYVNSKSNAGNPLHKVHADLIGETNLCFSDELHSQIDVLFLCVGHGDAVKFLTENAIDNHVKIIDLSQDFRLTTNATINGRNFIYGLPELQANAIAEAENIANPGCFATAIQLALLPLANAGILSNVYTTGITGSTGAGQSLSATAHFSWRANNISAYKTLQHQHCQEIHQSLHQLQPQFPIKPYGELGIQFIPWRGDFTRGIYTSNMVQSNLSLKEAYHLYNAYYEKAAFTHVAETMIDLKQVVNTNKCLIHIEKNGNQLVIHSAIDNLLKGASGQAVQNMNIQFNLPQTTGLRLKANLF
ncbi:MAG: N-acetyl-gamma-glutamyl-phosphate reductase [Chitinophagaceae bacterium]